RLLKDLFARGQNDKIITFTLGNIADKRNDLQTAIEWWTRTMSQDSQHYEALFNIGVAYYKLSERERAVQCWKRVLDLNPDLETRQIVLEALKQVE
ncbi:MAG TPA: tetratricopeptide repeat protein, partial [Candidatus Ozemobacteraceae bacterium]|nr:tetratricopeptide repeat protein [Candidatus Ozemobacteraceae bacterium]